MPRIPDRRSFSSAASSRSGRSPYLRPSGEYPGNHSLPAIYRVMTESGDVGPVDPHVRDTKIARLEAALILADEPLAARKLAQVAGLVDTEEVRRTVERLRALYDADGTAFQVEEIAGGYQLLTRATYHPWLMRLRRSDYENRLTPTALETLAVVAYRQPVTRADVEAIRGVACGEMLTQLMEKGHIKIIGRHESLGRPVIFGTTKKFLQTFGLNSLKDLPEAEQLKPPAVENKPPVTGNKAPAIENKPKENPG